ncbi:MAG: alpha-galactosidase [Candidatus Roseilinea sp.]|nr:MAG: alpha-galactosidase [Candidatus Roseilinea sp.]
MELHLHPPAEALLQNQGLTLAHLRLTAWDGASAEPLSLPVQWHLSAPEADFWTLHFELPARDHALEITRLRLEIFLPQALWGQEGPLWSLQGAAVHWGQDFAFPLEKGFARENYLGHLQDAEGGGVPLVYLWNRQHGLALMHLETTPIEWYLPVERDETGVRMAFELRRPLRLAAGQGWTSPLFALSWHEGRDFFAPLERYREQMAARGLTPAPPLPASYEAAWCSWGYEFDVTAEDMLSVLPAARPMGLRWFTLDDRWFDAYGDWNPRSDTFPNGAEDLRRMNQAIHAAGGLSQLWWYPLCAEDGHGAWESHTYGLSQILREHPDWVVLDEQGRVARNNRHLAMLCPALPEVQQYTLALTQRFIEEWGFDGFKMDNIYTMPACHNPAHHHASPEDSLRAFGELYRRILELTRQLRPQQGVVQICPCGTPITFHLLPATDQTVTADPTSSAQVRQRIKFYKALTGRRAAVFADHVELSDGGVDFASGIATGGVPGTKFTWQVPPERQARLKENWQLSAQKFELWRFWFDLYQRYRLAEGEYLDLYDLAFDFPEAHLIRKDGRLYYAFFAETFDGTLPLRGLEARRYHLRDYEHDLDFGMVQGPQASFHARFAHHLLLEATPE